MLVRHRKSPPNVRIYVETFIFATFLYVRTTLSSLQPFSILQWVWPLHKYPQADSRGRPHYQK
ncbi:hypothetical protein DENIT_10992 [Pseudomonas veronii]|nr:hypothetical protein DENIT_10992 [Pseudomonas veronii]